MISIASTDKLKLPEISKKITLPIKKTANQSQYYHLLRKCSCKWMNLRTDGFLSFLWCGTGLSTQFFIFYVNVFMTEVPHCVKRVHIQSYSGLYFPVFRLNTERYWVSPYSFPMRENMDQNKSEYGHFLRSVYHYRNQTCRANQWLGFNIMGPLSWPS